MSVARRTLAATLGAIALTGAALAPQASAGTIAVTNRPEGGARFEVRLPIVASEAPAP